MFRSYARAKANDPDTYVRVIAAILSEYSHEVITHVTDPTKGLASRQKYFPEPAEVKEACTDHAAFLRRQEEGRAWRARGASPALPAPAREPGTDYFSMFEKHGRPFGRFEKGPCS